MAGGETLRFLVSLIKEFNKGVKRKLKDDLLEFKRKIIEQASCKTSVLPPRRRVEEGRKSPVPLSCIQGQTCAQQEDTWRGGVSVKASISV